MLSLLVASSISMSLYILNATENDLVCVKELTFKKSFFKPGLLMHAYNSNTSEVEEVHHEFKAGLN